MREYKLNIDFSTLLKKSAFFIAIISFLLSAKLYSQDDFSINYSQELNFSKLKKLELERAVFSDTTRQDTSFKKFVMKKNPWTAIGLSALLPGLGQYYNESYWKIPVIAGIGGYFVYIAIKNNNKFLDNRDLYDASITPENPNGDTRYKELREFYRNQRDQFILYFGLLYLINLADAYVDAHLFDFDVSEKFRGGVFVAPGKIGVKLSL